MAPRKEPYCVILEDTESCPRGVWLWERKKAVCSSDYPAVVGLSSFKTPLDMYVDKSTMAIEEYLTAEQKFRFDIGHGCEKAIREAVATQIGAEPIHDKRMCESTRFPYMRADIDGLFEMLEDRVIEGVQFRKGDTILFEGKTTNSVQFAEWRYQPPLMYQAQCKHAMIVRGLRYAIIGISKGNNLRTDFVYHLVALTPEDEVLIPLACQEFMEQNVQKQVPPDHTLGPYASAFKKALMEYYAPVKEVEPATCVLPTAMIPTVDKSLRLRAEIAGYNQRIRELEEERDRIEGSLVAMLGAQYQKAVLTSPYRTITAGYTISERDVFSADNLDRMKKESPELYSSLVADGYITHRVQRTFTVRQKFNKPRTLRGMKKVAPNPLTGVV